MQLSNKFVEAFGMDLVCVTPHSQEKYSWLTKRNTEQIEVKADVSELQFVQQKKMQVFTRPMEPEQQHFGDLAWVSATLEVNHDCEKKIMLQFLQWETWRPYQIDSQDKTLCVLAKILHPKNRAKNICHLQLCVLWKGVNKTVRLSTQLS